MCKFGIGDKGLSADGPFDYIPDWSEDIKTEEYLNQWSDELSEEDCL